MQNNTLTKIAILIAVFFISSCSSNEMEENPQQTIHSEIEAQQVIQKSVKELYPLRAEITNELIIENLSKNFKDENIFNITKSESANEGEVSEAANSVLDKLIEVNPDDFSTKEGYIAGLEKTLEANSASLSKEELGSLNFAIGLSSYIMDLYLENKIQTKGWWQSWGKCVAGILGQTALGALGGAATGSAVPGIGTTVGAIVGGIGGGLNGAASSC